MKRWIHAAYDPTKADEYVVKIWHEVEGMRGGMPDAAEEIFFTVANSPEEAIEQVKREYDGPIDRIEIVDTNIEDLDEDDYMEIPFDSSTEVKSSDMIDHVIDFDSWYDSLSSAEQAKVDDLADDLGLPLYEECDEAQLALLHDCFVSK